MPCLRRTSTFFVEMKSSIRGLSCQIVRSITVGIDECHVVHLLHWKLISIRMVDEHLMDVHAGTLNIRFRFYRWKEILLCSYPDNENCDDSDDVMCTHERLHRSVFRRFPRDLIPVSYT